MNRTRMTICFFISFVLISFMCFIFGERIYSQSQKRYYDKVAQIISLGVAENPNMEKELVSALKMESVKDINSGREILEKYGYGKMYEEDRRVKILFGGSLLLSLCILSYFGVVFFIKSISRKGRIDRLMDYVYDMNNGIYKLNPSSEEDELSILEDEIYKTVIVLRERQEKEKKEKEKISNNLADITHQLKTPLTSISLMVELLKEDVIEGEDGKYVESISAQIERLNYLVSSLLILSRIDADTMILDEEEINVGELISSSIDYLRIMIEKKNQIIKINSKDEISFVGDYHWTSEALMNIVKNCSEHTPCGGEIIIEWEENPICTEIKIKDSGDGIDKKDLRHIFTRFYKGENSSKNNVGIGLALARSIVKMQNGDITAGNRHEGGAEFIIKFYKKIPSQGVV